MEGGEEGCNTRLCLGIGCGGYGGSEERGNGEEKPPVQLHMLFPTPLDRIEEEEEEEKEGENCDRNGGGDDDHGKNGTRKKLKLTKEQSCMLEEIFRVQNTLTMVCDTLSLSLNMDANQSGSSR